MAYFMNNPYGRQVNFGSKAMQRLKQHSLVDEVEDHGCDDGRVFVHLKRGWQFQGYESASKTFSGAVEALKAVNSNVEKRA